MGTSRPSSGNLDPSRPRPRAAPASGAPRGVGTAGAVPGRHEVRRVAPLGDDVWWDHEPSPVPDRTLVAERARRIITTNRSPDVPFSRSINPYRGCEHGCVYCFARPTHAWLELSPGVDFERRLFFKPDAVALLRRELARPGYRPEPIAMGTNTDPYQPVEREARLTRGLLELLLECRHPVTLVTKGALVLRDLDLLTALARRNLVHVAVSLTTLDSTLKRRLEPRTADPTARLRVIRTLADAGVPTGVLAAPVVPALNDAELEAILEAARNAGARHAGTILLRLPHEVAPLFETWLETHYPERKEHVLSLVRQSREGRLYRSDWGVRMRGTGPFADLLAARFRRACKRLGLAPESAPLDGSGFRPPRDGPDQGELF